MASAGIRPERSLAATCSVTVCETHQSFNLNYYSQCMRYLSSMTQSVSLVSEETWFMS